MTKEQLRNIEEIQNKINKLEYEKQCLSKENIKAINQYEKDYFEAAIIINNDSNKKIITFIDKELLLYTIKNRNKEIDELLTVLKSKFEAL